MFLLLILSSLLLCTGGIVYRQHVLVHRKAAFAVILRKALDWESNPEHAAQLYDEITTKYAHKKDGILVPMQMHMHRMLRSPSNKEPR